MSESFQAEINPTAPIRSKVTPLTITPNAAKKIWELLKEEGNFDLKLRISISGGGCSGFQYAFTFDEQSTEDDVLIAEPVRFSSDKSAGDEGGSGSNQGEDDAGTVQLVVDYICLDYLKGAEIDYKSDLSGEQFIIRNPNAKSTCGCGSSFSI